ncbi:MAG: hypothetical protein GXP29_03295, partial [Planctomycetes bacterium]|nr:hypothetical protein [Planctomycetota bacterium]
MSNSNTACVLGIVLSFLCTARIATAADIPGQYRGLQQSKMAKLINVWGDPRPLHSHTVTGVAISPDGKIAFTSGSMPDLAFWDIRDGSELRMFKSQFGYGSAKGFSPD